MKIALGTDHAGFALKEKLKPFLESLGHEVVDYGAFELNPSDDYPDFVFPVARAVAGGDVERGIVIGSSGEGESIAANRIQGVRALVYYGHRDPLTESAKVGESKDLIRVSREDNNSNVLSIGASFVAVDEAQRVVELWLQTPFTDEARHVRRIKKLDEV